MKTVYGDIVKFALAGSFDVIIQGCNCWNTMGAGLAKQIKKELPEAYRADLSTVLGDRLKLGTYSLAKIKRGDIDFVVVNAYTQFHYGTSRRNVDYEAIDSVFSKIKTDFSGLRMAYPMIGAGLAGGDWKIISKIIDKNLAGEDHTLVKYT